MATNVYFKCPFCDKRLKRDELVIHIDKKHSDELPEGFTPLQATFHAVNKKDFSYRRPCRVCKKETKWDESKGRYDFLCGSQQCHDTYVKKMRDSMGEKCGINRQTKTAEGLEKMLAGRRISGKYKFSDGVELTYTGSYERKALEFFDNVLNVKASDLMVPGPVLKYTLDGKEHIYIPDMYYIPYNLIIEIKDGGNAPNKNPNLVETRRKQMAKEKYVIEKTKYNYIRLTNNDFSQLLSVFADLKMALVEVENDTEPRRVVHVNETMISTIHAALPPMGDNDIVVIDYMQNNVFAGKHKLAISDSPKFDTIFKEDENTGTIIKTDKAFLEDCSYNTYIIKNAKIKVISTLLGCVGKMTEPDFLYETAFGHKRLSDDQILFEEGTIPYEDYYYSLNNIDSTITNIIKEEK